MVDVRTRRAPSLTPTPTDRRPAAVTSEQALQQFQRDQGAGVRLSEGQAATLTQVLAGPDGAERAQVYLGLVASGVGIVPRDKPASRRRFDEILDGATQVWGGLNLGARVRGATPLDRVATYAQLVKQVAGQKGGLTDEAVSVIRRGALAQPGSHVVDVFEGGRPIFAGLRSGTTHRPVPAAPVDHMTPTDGARAPTRPGAPPVAGRLDLAELRSATARGDFGLARRNLEAAQQILRENPDAVSKQDLAAYTLELTNVAKAAEAEDDMGFWDILLAVLTLGLSLLVDHFTDADHEVVAKTARQIRARIDGLAHDPDGSVLGSVYGHPVPHRRMAGELIPGTHEAWSPDAVARILDDKMGGKWDGTADESRILDITHGLHIDDRIAVAEAYWARKGENITGRAALDKLFDKITGELDDNPFWQTRDGLIAAAQLDPANPTGQLQPHDMIMLDLKGVFSKNGAAIQRLLMRCDQSQLRAIDYALRDRYDISLEDALKKLGGEDERRALFLLRAPRVNGEVPQAYVRAFELREAVRGFGTDENRTFRMLESMSHADFLETARAYHELTHDRQAPEVGATVLIAGRTVSYPEAQRILAQTTDPATREKITAALAQVPTVTIAKLWNDKVDGDDGSSGEVRATGLYRRLFNDMNDAIGGDELWLQRLALASEGMRYEANPTLTPQQQQQAEIAHRQRAARYVAVSLRLAGDGKSDEQDLVALMGLIESDTKPGQARPATGMPTANDVRTMYATHFNDRNMRIDINNIAKGEVAQLCNLTLDGAGYNSPAAAAVRIHNAMASGLLGLGGTHEEVIYEILDRADLPSAERAAFIATVDKEYKQRYGGELRAALVDKFGAELELPGGRKIPSRVARLADAGILTPAERLVYAIHEKGAFGIFGKTEGDVIMQTLAGLSPLEKVVAMNEYARIMDPSRPFNPEAGQNPLLEDLRELSTRDTRRAEALAQIMPGDVNGITFEVAAYLNQQTNPVISAWLEQNIGDPDEWIAKNFPDEDPRRPGVQSAGLEGLRELVHVSGGPAQFAAKVSLKEKQFVDSVREMVTDSRGNGLSTMLMDFFGPEGAGLEVYARKVGAAVRDGEIYRKEHGGELDDTHAERIQQHYAELLARVAQYDQLKDQRVELVSNIALTVAIAGTIVAAPEVSSAVLMGIGAVTKAGTHLAFGEHDAVTLLQHAIRGGATGLIAHFGVAQLASMPPDVSLWLRALQGGIVGAETSVMGGAVYRATDGRTWNHGVIRGSHTLVEGAFHDAPVGFAAGAAVTVAAYYVQKGWDSLFGKGEQPAPQDGDPIDDPNPPDDPIDPGDPVDPDGPGRPGRPPDTPVRPGGPGRPGRPPDTPVRPGGPGRPGHPPSTGGPVYGGDGPKIPGPTTGTPGGLTGSGGGTPIGPGRPGGATGTPPSTGGPGRGATPISGPGRPVSSGRTLGTQPVRPVVTGRATVDPSALGRSTPQVRIQPRSTMLSGGQAQPGQPVTPPVTTVSRPVSTGAPTLAGRGGAPVDLARRASFTRSLTSASAGSTAAGGTATVGASTPTLTPPRPVTVAGAPPEVLAMQAGWAEATTAAAPVATLQVLLGAEAYHWSGELARPNGAQITDAGWADLIARAQHVGIAVPEQIPSTPAEALRLLETIRKGAVVSASGATTETLPGRTPRHGALPGLGTTPTPVSPTRGDPVAPAPTDAGTAELQRLEGIARRERRIDTLAAHSLFEGASREWIGDHGVGAAAFVLGLPPGALAGETPEAVIAKLTADDTEANESGTLYARMTRAQEGLYSFGLPRAHIADGVADSETTAAFDNALAIFGPVFDGNRPAVVDSLRSFGNVMEYASRAIGLPGTPSGATLPQLQEIAIAYKAKLVESGHLKPEDAVAGAVFNAAILAAHRAFKSEADAAAAAAAAKQAAAAQAHQAVERFTEAIGHMGTEVRADDVVEVSEAIAMLEQAKKDGVEGAPRYLDRSKVALIRTLDSPRKVADFLCYSAGISTDSLDALIDGRIISRYRDEQLVELGASLVAYDRGNPGALGSMPIGILDRLDDVMPRGADKERMQAAVLARKDVGLLISQDRDYLLGKAPVAEVARRIAELHPDNDKAKLTPLVSRLVGRINKRDRYQRGVAELILAVADHDARVASEMLRQVYPGLDSEEKDDFAMALSRAREGHGHTAHLVGEDRTYDDVILLLDGDVKETMAHSLYRELGWYVYTDAERAFAYYLRGENATTDRYGRHRPR